MGEDRYTSIYLPRKLKRQIVAAAEAEGFKVSRGRRSCLTKFVELILQERRLFPQQDSSASSLHQLTPELRSSIVELGAMSPTQQKRASLLLHLLLSEWQDQDSTAG